MAFGPGKPASALAASSGTTALTLALRALGIGPEEDVAVPSFTCASLLHAVRAVPARPLVCDVDPQDLCLDPEDLRRKVTRSLAAVVAVHPFGHPAATEDLRIGGARLIEDCAQSPGASVAGEPVGARGDAAIFSFGPTKLVTCGGPGGALTSPSASLVSRARDLATHDERDDHRLRLNALMGDLHAAIACVQVGRLAELAARRASIVRRYDEAFTDIPWARPRPIRGARPVDYRYLLRVPRGAEAILARLQSRGLGARRPVWRPLHQICPGSRPCPGADTAHDQWISLPLFPTMSEGDVERVILEVRRCLS